MQLVIAVIQFGQDQFHLPIEELVHSLAYADIFLFSSGYQYSFWY